MPGCCAKLLKTQRHDHSDIQQQINWVTGAERASCSGSVMTACARVCTKWADEQMVSWLPSKTSMRGCKRLGTRTQCRLLRRKPVGMYYAFCEVDEGNVPSSRWNEYGGVSVGGLENQRMPESRRAFWRIVSLTAAKTSRIFDVSVACVRLLSVSSQLLLIKRRYILRVQIEVRSIDLVEPP
jgi:hypothetical protein